MIYTCTCNPSLDYYLNIKEIKEGNLNRSEYEYYLAGGKGINVSIALNNLNIKTCAFGFLGGFTKEFYLSFFNKFPNIQPLFTTIKENTRIDIKIISKEDTSLNAKGPDISKDEFLKFKTRLNNLYPDDILIISGNIQESIEEDMISLINDLSNNGIKIVLDTNENIIKKCRNIPILLIRVSSEDIKGNEKEIIKQCQELHKTTKASILYYDSNNECIYIDDKIYISNDLDNKENNDVGKADHLVAGYIYSYIKGADINERIKYSIACAKINSLFDNNNYKDEIEKIYDEVNIKEL